MVFTEEICIGALAPFNFDLSAKIFSNGDEQIRRYENGVFWQVIRINKKLALACIESAGAEASPRLTVQLKTNCRLTEEDKKNAAGIVRSLFNLDFDVKEFYQTTKKDPTMTLLTKELSGLRSPTTQYVFEALIDSIVEQQISLKVANAFERRIIKKWGDALKLDDRTYYAYPTPKALASATQQELRAVGLSERKAEYINKTATLVSEGKLDLEGLKSRERDSDIIEELDRVKGIGVWTAELTMIRGMQRLGAFPADDLGLRRTISHFYCNGKPLSSSEARKIADNWGRWKGLAAYYLIIAEITNKRT